MMVVWLAGAAMSVFAATSMCWYRDDATLVVASGIDEAEAATTPQHDDIIINKDGNRTTESLLRKVAPTPTIATAAGEGDQSSGDDRKWWIPRLCVASDIGFALGSGMTIRFWGLFFQNAVGTTPVALSILLLVACLMTAAGTYIAQRLAKRHGRMRITVIWCVLGIGILFVMGLARTQWQRQWLMGCLYAVRTVLMNATSPLLRAVLMDSISTENRGKWASVSSIASVGWSGSAVLGGWLCDTHGYGMTFFITAIVQLLSTVPLLPLLWLERKARKKTGTSADTEEATV